MTDSSTLSRPSRTTKLVITLVVVAVAAVAVVWFVVAARSDDTRGVRTEPTAAAAIDGFVGAYNDGDTAELENRICRDRLTLVLTTLTDNRRTFERLTRSGPLQRSESAGRQQVTVQLEARGSVAQRGYPLLSVQPRADDGRWCVSTMTGAISTLPASGSR